MVAAVGARPTAREWAVAAAAGAALGLLCLLGVLPMAGLILFLACTALVLVFQRLYTRVVLVGVVLLACVFVEPSPSDVLLAAAIPLGLATGAFKPRELGRAALAAALMMGYLVASLPGIAAAADLGSAVRYYLITVYLMLLALFVCTWVTPDTIVPLLRAYLAAAFLSLAAGLVGLAGLFPDVLMADAYRVRGLFKDPNVFGPFFVPAVVLLLDDMGRRRLIKAPRAVHAAGVALLALGVVISYSRAAWINLAVSAAVYLALRVKTFRPARLLGVALAGAAVLGAACLLLQPASGGSGVAAFLGQRAQLQVYDKERFATQLGGVLLAAGNPAGVGPGQFERVIAGVTGIELSAHSLYVRTAAENGVAGFVLLMAGVACLLFLLGLEHLRGRREGATAGVVLGISPQAAFAILAGLMVNGIAVDTLHWRHLWFFIGVALYCVRESRRGTELNG